ncbi:MAG: ester cyclase [Chloroflexota bacterium]
MESARLNNIEIVRRAILAGDNNDNEQSAELTAPTHIGHALFDSYDLLKGEQLGYDFETTREEHEEWTTYLQEQYPHTRTTIDEIFEVGDDKVVYITTTTNTHKSGKEITTKGMSLDRIAEGKIVETWYSWDRLGYWQQLGFVPHVKELLARFNEL